MIRLIKTMVRLKKLKNAFQSITLIYFILPLIGMSLLLNYLYPILPTRTTTIVERVEYLDPILEIPFQQPDAQNKTVVRLRKRGLILGFDDALSSRTRRQTLGVEGKYRRKKRRHMDLSDRLFKARRPYYTDPLTNKYRKSRSNLQNSLQESKRNLVRLKRVKKYNIGGVESLYDDTIKDNHDTLHRRRKAKFMPYHISRPKGLGEEDDSHPFFMDSIFHDVFHTSQRMVNWKEGGFCRKFLHKTFQQPINVCGATKLKKSIECYGNSYSDQMGACILRNVAVNPTALESLMHGAEEPGRSAVPVRQLNDAETYCEDININTLDSFMESGDYINLAIRSLRHSPTSSKGCTKWINNDAYLLSSNNVHIYFRFLDYFNLHKLLEDYKTDHTEKVHVIRVSESNFKKYRFPHFDQKLFPEASVYTLHQFQEMTVCFRRIVLVPRSYASFPFRCKMSPSLNKDCLKCAKDNGKLYQIKSFRKRVLDSCGIDDTGSPKQGIHNVVIISRKIYNRYPGDKPYKFSRILLNEKAIVSMLRSNFRAKVKKVRMENLAMCQQVKFVHSADVLIGVHGAGLVHLWWLRNDSLLYEIEPTSQAGNPTFNMLAKLAGRNYMKQTVFNDESDYIKANIIKMKDDFTFYFGENEND